MARGHAVALDYHRGLLDDVHRMEAYDRAIRALVRPGMVVLDVGAGTGILSMLAARRGARVHAVESMPVAGLARQLIAANGLSDRIAVHHADLVGLDLVEPVDLVLGEFMGRFVVDDAMLDAMEAAGRWLKPDGSCCPGAIRMQLAPVGDFAMPMVDRFRRPLLGLDLSAGLSPALHTCYAAQLGSGSLLAPPADYLTLTPPQRPAAFAGTVRFTAERAGLFRGIAGFFIADLAPEVALSTAPGPSTHWGQYVFPSAPVEVAAGDGIHFQLGLDEGPADPVWRWTGRIVRGSETVHAWSAHSVQSYAGPPPARSPWTGHRAAVVEASNAGTAAFAAGDLAGAVSAWERATVLLGPDADDLAPIGWENLGLGYLNAGQFDAAVHAFVRALQGDPSSREPSLRHLLSALSALGRVHDVQHYLVAYRAHFGDLSDPPS